MSAREDILAGLRATDDGTVGDLTPEQLVDTYHADVLAEVTAWLTKKGREYTARGTRDGHAQAVTCAVLASKIARGAVRPDTLRMLPTAVFFEVDHVYAREHHASTIRFLVRHIDRSPDSSHDLVAFGWRTEDGDVCSSPFDSDDFTGWVDVTDEVTR